MVSKEILENHKGHKLEIVTYGDDKQTYNISLECLDCNEVLEDYDY